MTSYCPHCGTPGPDEARFCMKCGRERPPVPAALHAEARLRAVGYTALGALERDGRLPDPKRSGRVRAGMVK
ncbi:zinc ribbon domain-containing protein [Streptomyces scabiei]|uniref:zinc ribbon domain-containing protein n=1 Tax=Streptomyces scabiei TaxID=1930 RepID=UPI003977AE45